VRVSGVAVVTGAAGALGTAISRRLAGDGFELVLVDLADAVEERARELGGRPCRADITTEAGLDSVAAAAGGHVACLVNNAGVNRDGRAAKLSDDDFRTVIRVDLVAPARLAERLRPALAGGSIVNVSSRAALGNFGQANYVAAKSGLIGLTRALALRWAPEVRVNAVAPGLVASPMTAGMPPDLLAKLVKRVPAGRIGQPEDVAATVAHLVSPATAYVTGQVLFVCGGRSLG
jgi:NAD(P)-dependent dehydrogenase (short-subunit alcohol dehydrogenase family)